MRTTVDLPDPLFKELKTYSAQQGRKLKELLTEFIEDGLRQSKGPARKPATRSSIPIAIRRAKGPLAPALSNRQLQAKLDDEDAKRLRQLTKH